MLHAEVIEAQVNYDEVAIGAKVTFKVADDPPQSYTLVDSNEANPSEGIISYRSPVGSALVGHQVGDRVKVVLPNQEIIELEILNIE